MDANEFIDLLNNPEKVEGKSVDELKKLAAEYPYSQPVQLLYAIRLSQSSEYLFNRQLGKTSILTDDRSVLFDLFEREEATEQSAEISLEDKLQREFKIEEKPRDPQEVKVEKPKLETSFPADRVEEKLVQKEEPVKKKWPEDKSEVKAEPAKPKLDLSGLSPSERVKAILEENRRLREEFAGRKAGEPMAKSEPEEKPAPVENEPVEEPAEAVEEEVLSVEVENLEETPEAPVEIESTEEEENLAVFTIEEEEPEETIFSIEDTEEEESEDSEIEDLNFTYDQPETEEKGEDVDDGHGHSFGEWLQRLRKDSPAEDKEEQKDLKSSLDQKISLLDSFVEKLPELKKKSRHRKEEASSKASINMNRLMEDSDDGAMVTETLARVYVKQKHYDKAIKAYEIMKLKYPEKSSFFADQISEIRKLINSK